MFQNIDDICDFHCLNFKNEQRKISMEKRFLTLDISCNFYEGCDLEQDIRIKEYKIGPSSCMYGHLDMIYQFYYQSNKPYGIFCEDDILIHKDFKKILPKIIQDFNYFKLDVLLLGYLITFSISEYYNEFPLKNNIYTKTEVFPFNYHEFNNDIWGTQMYMISRENAKKILDKYYVGYLEKTVKDSNLIPFSADWTITKDGNRALLYPLIVIEDGKQNYDHNGQHNFHYNSFFNNYLEEIHI
jgi:GR25 family glycosyltransferase involved in LPS biosynthesis